MTSDDASTQPDSPCGSGDTSSLATDLPTESRAMDPLYEAKLKYRNLVNLMRGAKRRSFDANRFPWQTRIIIDELLDLAVNEHAHVEIFKGLSTGVFYQDRLRERCQTLVQHGGSARVIFSEHDQGDSRWRDLATKSEGKLQVLAMKAPDPELYHYCLVVGEDAYRLEFPHPLWEGDVTDVVPERPARFSFNDPELAQRIKKYSDELAQIAKPL